MRAVDALDRKIRELQSRSIRLGIQNTNMSQVNRDLERYTQELRRLQSSTALSSHSADITKINRGLRDSKALMEDYGRIVGLAARRFAAYSAGAGAFISLQGSLRTGLSQAIEFDDMMVRIGQTLGVTRAGVVGLEKEITRLSTSLGASSKELSEVALIFAQAGLGATQTKDALTVLAEASRLPTFTNMKDAGEGVIAIMGQFNLKANKMRDAFGSINAVSRDFAVEFDDIIKAIQRSGSVWNQASSNINDSERNLQRFIATFSSIRSATRESAETIATGIRTITTRLQRAESINAFEEIGVQMRDARGNFIGVEKAIENISKALGSLDSKDTRLSSLLELLGGVRQMSKTVPLITQFAESQRMLQVAIEGTGSVSQDAELRLESWATKIGQVRETWLAFSRDLGQDRNVRALGDSLLNVAKGAISVLDNIRPMLPMLAMFGGMKVLSSIPSIGRGLFGGITGSARVQPPNGSVIDRSATLQQDANRLLANINDNTRISRDYMGALTRTQVEQIATGSSNISTSDFLKNVSLSYRNNSGSTQQVSGLITNIVQAGERLSSGRRATSETYEIYQGSGKSIAIETRNIVQGTQVIHDDLLAIRNLLADLYSRNPSFAPSLPVGRSLGGGIGYHSFGNYITSGIVPLPYGAAARDASGLQKGTDTYAATVQPGSFILNKNATKSFGHKYLSGGGQAQRGGIPVMLTPGELVLSPSQVQKYGLANISRDNSIGREMALTGRRYYEGGYVYNPFTVAKCLASGGPAYLSIGDMAANDRAMAALEIIKRRAKNKQDIQKWLNSNSGLNALNRGLAKKGYEPYTVSELNEILDYYDAYRVRYGAEQDSLDSDSQLAQDIMGLSGREGDGAPSYWKMWSDYGFGNQYQKVNGKSRVTKRGSLGSLRTFDPSKLDNSTLSDDEKNAAIWIWEKWKEGKSKSTASNTRERTTTNATGIVESQSLDEWLDSVLPPVANEQASSATNTTGINLDEWLDSVLPLTGQQQQSSTNNSFTRVVYIQLRKGRPRNK